MSANIESYQRLGDIDHVLIRSGMYIGSNHTQNYLEKCLDTQTKRLMIKNVNHSEGAAHLFLEALGNACDNVQNTKEYNLKCASLGKKPIDIGIIECNLNETTLCIKNYGLSIPVAINSKEQMWIPQLIFGNLRSSSNYDDSKYRVTIGTNGLGIKLTNIFSKQFMIECADPERGLLYKQSWSNNMKTVSEPIITQYSGVGYTSVSYSLDFPRFSINNFDYQALEIYKAHACVASYTCGIPVIFNGERIVIPTLLDYAKLFFDLNKDSFITFTDPENIYDVCLCDTPDKGMTIAFVNGVIVKNGGVHVEQIHGDIVDAIKEFFGKSAEGVQLNRRDIVGHVSLFISTRVTNPEFSSQSKDFLKGLLPFIDQSGKKIIRKLPVATIPEKLINKIKNWKLIETVNQQIEMKQMAKLKKTDGKSKHPKVAKLIDANFAKDISKRHLTSLFVVEGDSASGFPILWTSFYPNGSGRDLFGIFPVSGKLLNTLNANFLQILNNTVFNNLKSVLGLEEGLDYRIPANFRKLRYGQVIIIPDSDCDGIHIVNLALLYFITRFYSLVQIGYVKFMRTPIITAKKGGTYVKFYTQEAYETWKSRNPDHNSWKHKYFKGLGSATEETVYEDFLAPRIVRFVIDDHTKDSVMLAFSKNESAKRKEWLNHFFNVHAPDMETVVDMPISNFINFELIEYSKNSVVRSIPEAFDGLKDCQRKALYTCMKRLKDGKDMKVEQIANVAAALTCYKHGSTSLSEAITLMAQDFIGSNNLAPFKGIGLFGTRSHGGKNFSSPRYINIALNWWIPYVFLKEDNILEKLIIDEGEERECQSFYPCLPLHVINGVVGIATGYSTMHHPHNPLDIAFWFQCRLTKSMQPDKQIPMPQIKPWVKGWTGQIELKKNGFISKGRFEIRDKNILITELPMNCWTLKYEEYINSLEESGYISSVQHYSVKDTIKILIQGYSGEMVPEKIIKKLKLSRVHSYNNMTVIYRNADRKIQPVIYSELTKLLEDFFKIRLAKYVERKQLILEGIQQDINKLTLRAKFIHLVNEGQIFILKRPKDEILAKMATFQLPEELHDAVKASEFSIERVQELMSKVADKQTEYNTIVNTNPEVMWYNDLENFIVKYCQHEKVNRSTYETTGIETIISDEIARNELEEQEQEDIAEIQKLEEEKKVSEQLKIENSLELV